MGISYQKKRQTPKRKASGSNPLRRTNPAAIPMIAAGFFGVPPVAQTHLDKPSVGRCLHRPAHRAAVSFRASAHTGLCVAKRSRGVTAFGRDAACR